MTDSLKHKIFIETDCISEQILFDYIDKKLSEKENHSIEKHLLHCELCSDAMEGLEHTKNRERIAEINQKISERIAGSQKETKIIAFNYKFIISIAASILLLIGGIFFFRQFNQKEDIAEFKSAPVPSSPQPPPPPPPPAPDEKTAANTVNSVSSGTSNEKIIPEQKAKASLEKNLEQDEPPAVEEAQESPPPSKTSAAKEINITGSGDIALRKQAEQTEENKKIVTIPAEDANNDSPEGGSFAGGKDAKLDEAQKQVTIADAPGTRRAASSAPVTPTPSYKPAVAEKKESYSQEDRLIQKSKKNNSYHSESLADEPVQGSIDMDKAEKLSYSPQSKVADDENVETETTTKSSTKKSQNGFSNVDQMPEFTGGQDSLNKFIHINFKYPKGYKTEKISDKIYVTFVVEKNGKIKDAKILKGINQELDKEALRVVNAMPKWIPGKNNGKSVSVNFNLPIKLE